MTRTARRLAAATLALSFVAAAAPALAAPDPCEGLLLQDGEVRSARRLLARDDLPPPDQACVQAIGAALAGQGGVRSVTVSVRLADAQRAAGLGPKVGAAYTKLLVAGGVPEARISAVVPAAAHGQEGQVSIAYVERRGDRPVARLDAVDGAVRSGAAENAQQPARRGDQLNPETWVSTGAGASTWLELADGSRLRLGPNGLLFIGRLYLNEQLRRVVKLELKRGQVEADVKAGGQGSAFEISTKSTVAGVRGTRFRLTADEKGSRLETLQGLVTLTGTAGDVSVPAGQGAQVGGDQAAAAATLLDAPQVEAPLTGPITAGAPLKFSAISGALKYRVELARDAEFTYDLRGLDFAAPGSPLPPNLPAGRWFWRVAAVDTAGLQGKPSRVHAFEQPGSP
jgi:hypothetical protein